MTIILKLDVHLSKKFIKSLLETISEARGRFKPKEIAKILIGESNSLIKQNMNQLKNVFGNGKEKSLGFWHSLIRQAYVKKLITIICYFWFECFYFCFH